ncbi:MAG TPA: PAS domain S-box protein [Armatimonadota bacterium]|jgi:PAS domain S-box-containing protein
MDQPETFLATDLHALRDRVLAAAREGGATDASCAEALRRFELWVTGNPALEPPAYLASGLPAALRNLLALNGAIAKAAAEVFPEGHARAAEIGLAYAAFSLEEAERCACAESSDPGAQAAGAAGDPEPRFRILFENAPIGIFQATVSGRFIDVNQTTADMFGFASPAQMLAEVKDIPNRLFVDPAQRIAIVQNALESGSFVRREVEYRRRDGSEFTANLHMRAVRSGDGAIDYVEGFVEDITARRQSERELRASEAMHRRLVETLQEGVWVIDADGRTTYANANMARMLGYTPEEMLGRHMFSFMDKSGVGTARRNLERRLEGIDEQHDFVLHAKDGHRVDVVIATSPLADGDGEYIGAIAGVIDITERKRTETAMIQSEQRLRFALEGANDGLWDVRLPEGTVYLSPRGCEILGYSPDEMAEVARVWNDLVHPDDMPLTNKLLQSYLQGHTPLFEVEQRLKTKSGQWKWILARGKVVERNESGEPIRMTGTHTDLTDRKRAEEAQAASAQFLRETQLIAGLGAYTLDIETARWESSDILDGIFGIDESFDRTVEGWSTLVHPDDRAAMVEYLASAVLETAEPFDKEYRIFRKRDGVERWVHGRGRLEYDARNQPIRMIGTIQDTTEARRADEALRVSLAKYRTLFESFPLGINVVDEAGRIMESNPIAKTLLSARLGGQLPREIASPQWQIVRPDGSPMPSDEFPSVLALTERRVISGGEIGIVGPDQTVTWLSVTAAPLPLEGHGVVITYSDVTERKRAEEALIEAARAKDRFIALLSHELRNPLSTIVNAAQVLKSVQPAEPRLLRARDAIERASATQARLLEDLLDVSRIALGRVALRLAPVDLGSLAATVVRSLAALAAAKGIDLSVDTEPDLLVTADEIRLEQVLFNLVVNAVKYTNEGSVWVTAYRDGPAVVLTVRDTGVGIGAEMLPQVFEVFTQADETLAHAGGGLGLGLSLVKSFVDLHGGTVVAESAGPGRGATFTVRLPAASTQDLREPQPTRHESHEAVRPGITVLLVDDNVDARETLRDILELDGCIIFEAEDGRAAIEVAVRQRPDVVLLDIGLPGLDGYGVARELRGRPETAGARIVAVTGYGQESDRERAVSSGFDDHLTKPVDLDLLRAALLGPSGGGEGE